MKKLLSLLPLSALLISCSGSIELKFVPLTNFATQQNFVVDNDNDVFYQRKEQQTIETAVGNISSLIDLYKYNKNGRTKDIISSTGNRKLLVIPVYFTDSDTHNQQEKTIFIQNAFFGESKQTTYDSVAGYYNKSSYGNLVISGEVTPWFNIGLASSQWKKLSPTYSTASNIIAGMAVDYLKENTNIDFDSYDVDEDGNIDGVYLVYDHPFTENKDSDNFFWAYTYYANKGEGGHNNLEPYVNAYSWTSINTIIRKDNRSYSNYLIHETGHLLGLSDYYNTYYSSDGSGSDFHYQPTGCFDMMDYNIGDHSSFSKYLLNWFSPMVIKNNVKTTLTLKPFTESGECLLIPSSSYNDSPFSEYLLIEYFTPNGLNKHSGSYSYVDKNGKSGVYTYPQMHGLRIYHVNASLGYFIKNSNASMICRVDDPDYENKLAEVHKAIGIDYAYSNTLTDKDAANGVPVLYHLLESSGENTFINAVPTNNETLFRLGSDFGITVFKDFTFNDGSKANFTLEVSKISTRNITIDITRK